jgi:dihydrofolate reductase
MAERTLVNLTLVAAMSENRVIGRAGGLPWHLPDELRHFKQVTTGGLVLMGRRTFESFEGLLPDRRHIVLTRNASWSHEQVETARDLDEALVVARRHGDEQLLVLGGSTIYTQTIDRADRMILTIVHLRGIPSFRHSTPPNGASPTRGITPPTPGTPTASRSARTSGHEPNPCRCPAPQATARPRSQHTRSSAPNGAQARGG